MDGEMLTRIYTEEDMPGPDTVPAIQLQTSAQGQAEKNRVARCLKALGLSRIQVRETRGARS
jgi:hypothetical protein